jgi:hypothetical protein
VKANNRCGSGQIAKSGENEKDFLCASLHNQFPDLYEFDPGVIRILAVTQARRPKVGSRYLETEIISQPLLARLFKLPSKADESGA